MICPSCGWTNLPGQEMCGNCQHDLTRYDQPYPRDRVERSLMQDPVNVLPLHAPVAVPLDTPLCTAINRMLDENVGAVLVVDSTGRLAGILSERDLLEKVAGVHSPYAELPVGRFMTARPESVAPTDTLNFALHKMDAGGYRHVPVVDAGRPVSVVSVRDMIRHITRLCKEG
jgi:CBS domain-containing protein